MCHNTCHTKPVSVPYCLEAKRALVSFVALDKLSGAFREEKDRVFQETEANSSALSYAILPSD